MAYDYIKAFLNSKPRKKNSKKHPWNKPLHKAEDNIGDREYRESLKKEREQKDGR